jgi:hypothetical protein
MSCAGGVHASISEAREIGMIYRILRLALQQVSPARPFRGAATFSDEPFFYTDVTHGTLESFWGEERISRDGQTVYDLRYAGGLLR